MTHDHAEGRLDRAGLCYLGIVYVVWGSTYLAIRLAVRPGAGFPPFTLGALRVLTAAVILFAAAALTRQRLRPRAAELPVLIGGGLLLWPLANGLVVVGETRAASGFAALLVGSMPIWVAIMAAHLDRRLPTGRFMAALLVGFAGVALLAWPVLRTGGRADVLAVVALLAAPVTWGAGSLWQRRRPVALAPLASAAWQQFFGGLGFIAAALALRERRPAPTPAAWGAWAYLTVFGSVIAFTSYVQTLRRLPMRIVSTYAYVNPVVAVALGWVVLREQVTGWTLAGATLVLLGVAGVFHERGRGRRA